MPGPVALEPRSFTRRQGEGEVVIVTASIRTGQRAPGAETCGCKPQRGPQIFQRPLRVRQRVVSTVAARIEQPCFDLDIVAQERAYRERVKASLQFSPSGDNPLSDVFRHGTSLIVDDTRDMVLGRQVEPIDLAADGDLYRGFRRGASHPRVPAGPYPRQAY